MLEIATRDNINVIEIRRESHSAKNTGQRPVFNELLTDIRSGKFNGILTWAADRLSRNAGDLGALVDLMDQGLLKEIRAHGQTFTNNPNEKFLLMILGNQALGFFKYRNHKSCLSTGGLEKYVRTTQLGSINSIISMSGRVINLNPGRERYSSLKDG